MTGKEDVPCNRRVTLAVSAVLANMGGSTLCFSEELAPPWGVGQGAVREAWFHRDRGCGTSMLSEGDKRVCTLHTVSQRRTAFQRPTSSLILNAFRTSTNSFLHTSRSDPDIL